MPSRESFDPLQQVLAAQAAAGLANSPGQRVVESLSLMVAHPEYPCLGARSVFRRERARVLVLEDMADLRPHGSLQVLSEQLGHFAAEFASGADLASLVTVFRSPLLSSEEEFEASLWGVLRELTRRDQEPWSPGTSPDPASPHFSFSHRGTAFFVVGLHPHASRIARRAPLPTMVFNLHAQFERLRADGGFERMRDAIRRRDIALNGDLNPMVSDHGEASEARQYSGRVVADDWQPPPWEDTQ